ncbi:MAG TPA: hypothetical protein VKB52_10465 [Rhodanobacteraceae bacterium]|nr:hypothetical protein [Rhodanobacteraceae bacterium]
MNTSLRFACALVALVACASAGAVSLSRTGIGQALVYPFYTADNSQDTLLSVVNASGTGKAVQVSFLEGYSGRHVQDLVVFLKAHDVWTASVSADAASGGAVLRTSDTSCTLPAVPASGLAFSSASYDGSLGYPNDGGPYDISRLREGMFDMVVGGDIVAGSPTDLATQHPDDNFPEPPVPPVPRAAPSCESLDAANYFDDLVAPAGGIYGSGAIVNVGIGTYFAYNADALADFTRTVLLTSHLASPPGLKDVNNGNGNADVDSDVFDDDGHPIRLRHNYGEDAVTSVFMTDAIYNDYIVDPGLGAATDWVITFPAATVYSDPRSFPNVYSAQPEIRDREEGIVTPPCNFCTFPTQLTHVVNVIAVTYDATYTPGTPTGVLGSPLNNVEWEPFGNAGSLRLSFDFEIVELDLPPRDANGGLLMLDENQNSVRLLGAPAAGFMVYNIINAQAQPGRLANYGGAFAHHATFKCQGPASECSDPIPTQ